MEGAIKVAWQECAPGCTEHAVHWDRTEERVTRKVHFPKLRFDSVGAYLEKEDGEYDDRH